tara:strand:- start:155 stop:313 length:159 start_codon:yes stop_codon:yes gene_type:complete
MDTQLNNYIVLKNGKPMDFQPRPINQAIWLIRKLEEGLDRLTQHSPYTIARR